MKKTKDYVANALCGLAVYSAMYALCGWPGVAVLAVVSAVGCVLDWWFWKKRGASDQQKGGDD